MTAMAALRPSAIQSMRRWATWVASIWHPQSLIGSLRLSGRPKREMLNPVVTTGSSMKIGEAAAASGCHLETIRYYERIGLLPKPARRANGYRDYGEEEVDRLRFIARGRELGFSLEEVRTLVRLAERTDMSCDEVDRLARQQLGEVQSRILELQRMARELQRTIDSCVRKSRGECSILGALQQTQVKDSMVLERSCST
jgi:MerR family mercuric resistance operon transcriptional regulator